MTRRSLRRKYRAGAGVVETVRTHGAPLVLAFVALLSAGCSVTMPVATWGGAEEEPAAAQATASLPEPKPALSFARDLGVEDRRRAFGAMGLALDPQGNGAPVSWNNPESGMKGEFVPLGAPFLKSDEICRAFIASMQLQTGPDRQQGLACRLSGSEWSIRELKPAGRS